MGSAPGRIVLALQVLANVHEGEDVDEVLVIVDGVDDALTLHDKLTNMLGVGFGDLPADAG